MRFFSKDERLEIENILLYYIKTLNDFPLLLDKGMIMQDFINHGIDNPSYFTDLTNRKIFMICLEMYNEKIPINTDSFQRFLEKRKHTKNKNQIFEKFLFNKFNKDYSHALFEYYIYTFKEHLIMDYWNFILNKKENDIWKNDDILVNSFGIVDGFKNLWDKFTINQVNGSDRDDDLKSDLIQRVENRNNNVKTSVKTGLAELDEYTGGFEDTEVTLIAGRPSMGKTTVAISLAKRMIFMGNIVHFFTLEMTRKQIINKFVADDLDIEYKDLKRGNISQEVLEKVLELYDFYDTHEYLIIDELKTNTLSELYSKMKKVKAHIRFIDYLQLLYLDGEIKKKAGNREQEVSEISKAIKRFAKEIKNPIIALCQLSRAVESRGNKKPQLSDLRESGSLEQDADNIAFVFREAYYDKLNGVPVAKIKEGNVELIFAKGREIGLKNLEFWLDLEKNKIEQGFKY